MGGGRTLFIMLFWIRSSLISDALYSRFYHFNTLFATRKDHTDIRLNIHIQRVFIILLLFFFESVGIRTAPPNGSRGLRGLKNEGDGGGRDLKFCDISREIVGFANRFLCVYFSGWC